MFPTISSNTPTVTQRQGLVLMKNIPAGDLSNVLEATNKSILSTESVAYVKEPPLLKGKSFTRRYLHEDHMIYQLVQPTKNGDTFTQALISVPTHVSQGKAQLAEENARKKENVILSTLSVQLEAKHMLEHYLPKDGTGKNLYYLNSSPLDFQGGMDFYQNVKHQRVVDILDDSTYDLTRISKKEDRLFNPNTHH
jgi:hypothetical protein